MREERLQLDMELEAMQKIQEQALQKVEADKQKALNEFVDNVTEAEANNKALGTANVQVTEDATRLAAKILESKGADTAVRVTPTEQEVIDAHAVTATRKRGRPLGSTTLKAQLELFGSEPDVALSPEEESDLGKRVVFACTDTANGAQFLCEGNPPPGIAGPEINYWKPILFPENEALTEQYKENFAPYHLIFTSLEGSAISDAAREEGGWAYWQVKIWSSLQVAGGVLLLVVSASITDAWSLIALLEITGIYTVQEQPLMLITPARNGAGSTCDSVAWVLIAVKEGVETVSVADPKDLAVIGKGRYSRQEFSRSVGIYKANATKPQYQLHTKEGNFRREKKSKKAADTRFYKREYNFAAVTGIIYTYGKEGCSVYNGNGGLGGILPMAVLRMGYRGFFFMDSKEEMFAHERRAAWAYKVFSGSLNVLTGLGEPAKQPEGAEKWEEITRGVSFREIHGEYLADQSKPVPDLLQVKAPARKRLKVLASNDATLGSYLEELCDYAGELTETKDNCIVDPCMLTVSYDPSYEFVGFKNAGQSLLQGINAANNSTNITIEEQAPRPDRSMDTGYRVFTTAPLNDGDPIQALFGNVYCLPEKKDPNEERNECTTGKEMWQCCSIIGEKQTQVIEASAGLQRVHADLRMALREDCFIPHIRQETKDLPANCEWVYRIFESKQIEGRKNVPDDGCSYSPTYERMLQGRSFIRAKVAIPVPPNGKVELVLEVDENDTLANNPVFNEDGFFAPEEVHFFDDERFWWKSNSKTPVYSEGETDKEE